MVARLLEAGATDDQVFAVFASNGEGIGARYREQGPSYLERTIAQARARLDVATALVLKVWGKPERMYVDLLLVDGSDEGLKFTTGISTRSTAWRWVFSAANVAVPASVEERVVLEGRTVGVKLGHSPLGLVEVRRWLRPPAVSVDLEELG